MVANECRWWRLLISTVRNSTDLRKRIRMLWRSWQTYLHSRVTFETVIFSMRLQKKEWIGSVGYMGRNLS